MRLSNNDYLNTAYYMNMDESNSEIPVDDIPENWFDTPEISTWLASRDFPFDTVENMLSYLKAKFDYSVNFRLPLDYQSAYEDFAKETNSYKND